MTLGSALKEARLRARMSLRDVEKATGISNGYLSQLESDHVKQPSPHHLYRLAEVYGRDYAELMEAAGYAVPEGAIAPVRPAIRGLVEEASDLTAEEARRVREYIQLLRAARRVRGE